MSVIHFTFFSKTFSLTLHIINLYPYFFSALSSLLRPHIFPPRNVSPFESIFHTYFFFEEYIFAHPGMPFFCSRFLVCPYIPLSWEKTYLLLSLCMLLSKNVTFFFCIPFHSVDIPVLFFLTCSSRISRSFPLLKTLQSLETTIHILLFFIHTLPFLTPPSACLSRIFSLTNPLT